MTNLLAVLPDFDLAPHTHILPSLEKALVATADLLTLDPSHLAKRAHVPPAEVKKLADALAHALQVEVAATSASATSATSASSSAPSAPTAAHPPVRASASASARHVTTLDDGLDSALGGGIAHGHLTEIVGESAAGKTQFMLTLLLAVQLARDGSTPSSSRRQALYISTEAPLQTTRLTHILQSHPKLANLPSKDRPSLNKVHSTHIHDLEAQEHILRYQVPVALEKHNVGILVIDSIAANYRAEFDRGGRGARSAEYLAKRNAQLAQTAAFLRRLARKYDVAIVVANQVADRFTLIEPGLHAPSQSTQSTRPGTPSRSANIPQDQARRQLATGMLSTDDPLALDHQQRFFTGWGDDPNATTGLKTPSLGLTWTNQLSTRIALLKDPIYEVKAYAPGDERNLIGWNRWLKVVFSPWCMESSMAFEIWEGGIRSVGIDRSVEGG